MSTIVVHVSANRYPPFPAEHSTVAIWRELARGAAEYHIVARSETARGSHTRDGNIHLHLLPSLFSTQAEFLLSMWLLPFLVRRIRPTLIVVQCAVLGGLAASFVARRLGIALWVEIHGAHYFRSKDRTLMGRFFQLLAPLTFAAADRIRALSDDMKADLGRNFGVDLLARTVVVPTRVDLRLFRPPKQNYATSGPVRLVCVGAFAPVKNHLGLIECLAHADFPFSLHLVGDGPLRPAYIERVRALGLEQQIEIGTWVDQHRLVHILRSADVFVHCSIAEGLPRAILEAMALALPIVATRVGFVADAIVDEESGLLVSSPPDDAMLDTLRRLSTSESLRQTLGSAALQRASGRYEWSGAFERYREAMYGTKRRASSVGDQERSRS